MSSVLRVRDKYGNIVEVPAIKGDKGDKGDVYVLTEADKEEIANMAKPDIDQTYSPESNNPQSGKAVAEAVAEKWEKIADTTLSDGDAVINVTTDMNGGTFALKRFFIMLKKEAHESDTAKSVVWVKALTEEIQTFRPFIATEGITALANNTLQTWRFEGEIQHLWNVKAYGSLNHNVNSIMNNPSYGVYGARDYFMHRDPVTAFQFTWGYSGALPNGSRLEIWGVRA